MMIMEGVNCTFFGSQETIFRNNATVKEAMNRVKNKEKIKRKERLEYIQAFEFRDKIFGLEENEIKCYKHLKRKFF